MEDPIILRQEESKKAKIIPNVLIAIFILDIILFFLPLFSMDYTGYNNISGINYSTLVNKLEEAFVNFTFIDIGILLYLIPLLSSLTIVLLLTNVKIKLLLSNVALFFITTLLATAYKSIDFLSNLINSRMGYYIYNINVSIFFCIYICIQVIGIILVIIYNQNSDVAKVNNHRISINVFLTIMVIIAVIFVGVLIGNFEAYLPWFYTGEPPLAYFIKDTLITLGGIILTIGLFMVALNKTSNKKKRSDLLIFNIISTLIYVASIYFQGISIMFIFSTILIISVWAIWLLLNRNIKQINIDCNL